MDMTALKKEARDKKTTDSRLQELANMDVQLSRAIAKRAAALSADMFEYLARHSDMQTQRAIAAHAKAPIKVLEFLSGHGQWTVLKAVAENANTPTATLERLAKHKRNTVRQAVAQRDDISDELVEQFVSDTDPLLRQTMIGHAKIQTAQLERLLLDPSVEVRFRMASIWNNSSYANRLLKDEASTVVAQALRYCDLEALETEFDRLCQHPDQGVLLQTAKRLNRPDLLASLANGASTSIQEALANNPFTPDDILAQFAHSTEKSVQKALAWNPFCPAQALHTLAEHVSMQSEGIYGPLEGVVKNPSTPPETLRMILNRGYTIWNYANAWGETPNWPADVIVDFAQKYYSYRNADEPAAVRKDQKHFDKIASKEPAEQVLAFMVTCQLYSGAAAGNRHTPPEALEQFFNTCDHDKHSYTLEDMARNPAVPLSVLQRMLATHTDDMLNNVFLPDSILNQIADDEEASGSYTGHFYARSAAGIRAVRKAKGITVDDNGVISR